MQALWLLHEHLGPHNPYTKEFKYSVDPETDPDLQGPQILAGKGILEALLEDSQRGHVQPKPPHRRVTFKAGDPENELMIDLHVHTTASDGALSPREVVRLAIKHGLKAIAITDHDSVTGIPDALDEAQSSGLEVIPGVELSAVCKCGTLHILGYYVQYENTLFRRCLDALRDDRQDVVRDQLANLKKSGTTKFPWDASDPDESGRLDSGLLGCSGKPLPSRSDVADNELSCSSFTEPYGPHANLLPHEAVSLILAAGGIPVVAHPYSVIKYSSLSWELVLDELTSAGIQGVEAYSPTHTVAQTLLFLQSAKQHGLLVTGGSDFHDQGSAEVQLGSVPGWGPLPYEIVKELKGRRSKHRR
jgi:predicted metal-dependent phosphoesterase TrpH